MDDEFLGYDLLSTETPSLIARLGQNAGPESRGFFVMGSSDGDYAAIAQVAPGLPKTVMVLCTSELGATIVFFSDFDSAHTRLQRSVSATGQISVGFHGGEYRTSDGVNWTRIDGTPVPGASTLRTKDALSDPGVTAWLDAGADRDRRLEGVIGCLAPELHTDSLVALPTIAELLQKPDATVRSIARRGEGTSFPERQFTQGGKPLWSRNVIERYHGYADPIYDVFGHPLSNWFDGHGGEPERLDQNLSREDAIKVVRDYASKLTVAGLNIQNRDDSYLVELKPGEPLPEGESLFGFVYLSDPNPAPVTWPSPQGGDSKTT